MITKKTRLLAALVASLAATVLVEASEPIPSEPATVAERPAWPSHVEHTTESITVSTTDAASESSQVGALESGDAYVLQVGAFRERILAEQAVKEIELEGLKVIATRRGEDEWYVLVLGPYKSHVDAREAGEVYLDAHPGGSIWVRAAADLRESLVDR